MGQLVRSNRYGQSGKATAAVGQPLGQQTSALRSGKANPVTKYTGKRKSTKKR